MYWDKRSKRWIGQIRVNYKKHHLGSFKNPKDAALAYNKAAIKYFGKFASLNKI